MSSGLDYSGTYRGNAETAKPKPKVARAAFLSRPVSHPEHGDTPEAVDAKPDQSQTRMGAVKFLVGLLKDEPLPRSPAG